MANNWDNNYYGQVVSSCTVSPHPKQKLKKTLENLRFFLTVTFTETVCVCELTQCYFHIPILVCFCVLKWMPIEVMSDSMFVKFSSIRRTDSTTTTL